MYRDNASQCPACDGLLVALQATLPIAGCHSCGGVWLGPEGTIHVLRGLGDELEREIARASAHEAREAKTRPKDPGLRSCPTCAQPMGRLGVGDTVVDSCPAHGAWFDREELGAVVATCGKLRRRHAGEESAFAAVWGLFVGILERVAKTLADEKAARE